MREASWVIERLAHESIVSCSAALLNPWSEGSLIARLGALRNIGRQMRILSRSCTLEKLKAAIERSLFLDEQGKSIAAHRQTIRDPSDLRVMSRFLTGELNTLFHLDLWLCDYFTARKSAEKYGKTRKIGKPKTAFETGWVLPPPAGRIDRLHRLSAYRFRGAGSVFSVRSS